MKKEYRNLKGEIFIDDDQEKWYQLDSSTWILLFGLTLFNVGCFLDPTLIDGLIHFLDLRFWPWWYFPIAIVYLLFAIQWIRIYLATLNDNLDEVDEEKAARFRPMSIIVTLDLGLIVVLHTSGLGWKLGRPFYLWSTYGTVSWVAVFTFFIILILIVVTIHYVKEWLVVFGSR